jgi:hypothetical protein
MQVDRPADPTDLAPPGQLGRHRDRVGWLALAVELEDGLEDQLVGRLVEVMAPDQLQHVGDGVLAHQHRTQDRLLRRQILGPGVRQSRVRFVVWLGALRRVEVSIWSSEHQCYCG